MKDIRIGEYEEFTRIAFELDTHAGAGRIESTQRDKVHVIFPHTRPELIRKIAVENSRNILNIKILSDNQQLEMILELASLHGKVAFFTMQDPHRMVVDIYWTMPKSDSPSTEAAMTKQMETKPPEPRQAESIQPEGDAAPPAGVRPQIMPPPASAKGPKASQPPSQTMPLTPSTPVSENEMAPADSSLPADRDISRPRTDSSVGSHKALHRTNWLEYYLVITLVIITIVILGLLVLMLLTRHHVHKDMWCGPSDTKDAVNDPEAQLSPIDAKHIGDPL